MLLDILRACVSVDACVSHPWARSCCCKCVDPRISCPRGRNISLDLRLWRKRVSYLLSPEVLTFLLCRLRTTLQESRSLSWSWYRLYLPYRTYTSEEVPIRDISKAFRVRCVYNLFDYRRNTGMIIMLRGIMRSLHAQRQRDCPTNDKSNARGIYNVIFWTWSQMRVLNRRLSKNAWKWNRRESYTRVVYTSSSLEEIGDRVSQAVDSNPIPRNNSSNFSTSCESDSSPVGKANAIRRFYKRILQRRYGRNNTDETVPSSGPAARNIKRPTIHRSYWRFLHFETND